MGAAIGVNTELSLEQLERLYLDASTPLEQRRAHVILLRAEGMAPGEVARIVRVHPSTIAVYVRRFNEHGPDSLADARANNPGRPPLLDDQGLKMLERALKQPPEDGGRWSGPKVARWLETYLDRPPDSLDDARGWEALKALGYSYKSSRPEHTRSASPEQREPWKKKSG